MPKASIVEEARGLRPDDRSRPGDLVVLHFAEGGQILVFDGFITTVYRNTMLPKVAVIPGFAAKQVEDMKLKADADSLHPVSSLHGGRHRRTGSFPLPWRMIAALELTDMHLFEC